MALCNIGILLLILPIPLDPNGNIHAKDIQETEQKARIRQSQRTQNNACCQNSRGNDSSWWRYFLRGRCIFIRYRNDVTRSSSDASSHWNSALNPSFTHTPKTKTSKLELSYAESILPTGEEKNRQLTFIWSICTGKSVEQRKTPLAKLLGVTTLTGAHLIPRHFNFSVNGQMHNSCIALPIEIDFKSGYIERFDKVVTSIT